MQITSPQDNLLRALRTVGRAVPARAALPITQNVLIETEDARLKVSATDLALSIRTWTTAQIYETGSLTLPARALTDTINSFPTGLINLDSMDLPYGAKIRCESINTTLRGTPPDEYPPFPDVSGTKNAKIDSEILANALDRVVFAAATDDARPVLTAVKMEVKGTKAKFIAADGFRLSIETAQLVGEVDEPFEALIPARALYEVKSLLNGVVGTVQLSVSENNSEAMFSIGDNVELITQLIAGQYPDYNGLIPKDEDLSTTLSVPIKDLKQLVRPMQVVAKEGSAALKIMATRENEQGKLTLLASAEDFGTSEAAINIALEGNESKIAFNVKFVSELIAHLQSKTSNPVHDETDNKEEPNILLQIDESGKPALFKHSSFEEFRHVVMPLYIQW